MIHNMWFNTSTGVKLPYHTTQGIDSWWDNGSLPIWITAQRQASAAPLPHGPAPPQPHSPAAPRHRTPTAPHAQLLLLPWWKSHRQATISSGRELTSSLETQPN